jgi:GntR family transcriptional regulator
MITFHLNKHSGVPPYLQIVQQVKHALRMGILQEGDRLPTVKEVVRMVVINPNTVFKAYRELESEGLIEGRTGSGTFARARPPGPPPSVQAELAAEAAMWIQKARAAGLDEELIEALLRSALHNEKEGKHE